MTQNCWIPAAQGANLCLNEFLKIQAAYSGRVCQYSAAQLVGHVHPRDTLYSTKVCDVSPSEVHCHAEAVQGVVETCMAIPTLVVTMVAGMTQAVYTIKGRGSHLEHIYCPLVPSLQPCLLHHDQPPRRLRHHRVSSPDCSPGPAILLADIPVHGHSQVRNRANPCVWSCPHAHRLLACQYRRNKAREIPVQRSALHQLMHTAQPSQL